jgi:hypothetical protein
MLFGNQMLSGTPKLMNEIMKKIFKIQDDLPKEDVQTRNKLD